MAFNMYRNDPLIQVETYETPAARANDLIEGIRKKWALLRERNLAGAYPVEILRSGGDKEVKVIEVFRWNSQQDRVNAEADTEYRTMSNQLHGLASNGVDVGNFTQVVRGFNENFPPVGGVELLKGVCSCLLNIDGMVKDFRMSVKNGIVLMHRSPRADIDGDGLNEMYLKILMHGGEIIQGALGPIRVEQNFNLPNDGIVKSHGGDKDFPATAIWRVYWRILTPLGAVLTDPDTPLIFGPATVGHYPPVGTHFPFSDRAGEAHPRKDRPADRNADARRTHGVRHRRHQGRRDLRRHPQPAAAGPARHPRAMGAPGARARGVAAGRRFGRSVRLTTGWGMSLARSNLAQTNLARSNPALAGAVQRGGSVPLRPARSFRRNERPYWLACAGWRSFARTEPPARFADVVVVGGGLMGVAVAYWLAKAGAGVQLLEAETLCFGATGRNLGLFLAGASAIEDPGLTASVVAAEGIAAGFRKVGHLAVTERPEIWDRIVAEVQRRPPGAPPLVAADRGECERRAGAVLSAGVLGGRWYEAGRVVDPVKLTLGLAHAARRYGACISEGTRVREVVSRGGSFDVRTEGASMSARHAVIACNAWTRTLVPALAAVLRPVVAQVLATAPGAAGAEMGLALDWGTVYWRHLQDGAILAGGLRKQDRTEDPGHAMAVNPRVHEALTAFLARLYPGRTLPPVRRRWAGIMDETPDGRPLVGRLGNDGPWIAAGLGGHGLPPALGLARRLARAIAEGATPAELHPYRLDRFDRRERIATY